MAGMPHFERCVFTGEFPVARLDFSDRHFPGAVRLTAFNPFIPTNADDSSLPAAFFTVRLENDTAEPLTYTVAFSACNFFAKNSGIHRLRREGEQTYLVLANPEKEDSFDRGDLTLATDADDSCGQEYWFRGNWFDSLSVFWQDFTAPWPLRERRYETNAETVNVMDIVSVRQQLKTKSIYDIPLRVTYYARVSSESDEQLNSLGNQITYYEDLIRKNAAWTYVPGYIDEGLSGISTKKRENFNRMIEDAAESQFDLVITKEISRFARNTLDSIQYTRQLLSDGVGVFFQNDNINTFDEDSELRLSIMLSLSLFDAA